MSRINVSKSVVPKRLLEHYRSLEALRAAITAAYEVAREKPGRMASYGGSQAVLFDTVLQVRDAGHGANFQVQLDRGFTRVTAITSIVLK